MSTEDAKIYLAERKIAPLFESLLTGLMFKKPPDHIQFMIDCLQRAKDGSIDDEFTWNYFMDVDSRPSPLPPILVKKSVTESKAVNKICTAPSKSQENPHSNLPIALPSRSFSTPLPPIQIPRVKQSKPIVSIIGGPGLGKEFYANYLAEQHPGWVVLSIGQILHETILVNSPTSEKWKAAKSSFFSGELISELEMLSVFPDCFDKHPHADGYILCGYPQTPRQLKNFENSATDENPKIVIFLDCDVEDIRNRLRHEDSNAVERRLENFKELTLSIVDYYNAIGKLITFKITEKVDPNEIAAQINQKFEEYVLKIPRSTIPSHHDSKVFQTKHTNRKEDLPQCPIIFFMGGPGSGKRYFCRKIAEKYPFVAHISIGNILNEEFLCQEPDHEDQNIMISQLIQSGNSLSQEKLISLIVAAIKNNPDAGIILIEDFPRDADQVKAFNENIGGLDLLIMLDCEEDYLKSKLTENFKLELQAEYIAEAVENRLNFFRNKTLPVIDHYKMMGKTQFINGSRNEKDVLIDIFEIMDVLEPVDKKIGSAQELKISVTGVNDIAPEGASVEQTTKTDLVAEDIKQNLETEPLHANISVEETETEAASSDTQEDIVVVFIVGGPGSGKGTQCDKLVRKFGFVHLSSGELLREEVSINSAIGKNVKELMEKGHLVPLDTVLKLLKNAVLTKFSTNRLFLIDGYPREVEQGIKFESEVAKCSFVIYFEVADETMISRLKNRLELSGRTDDNEQTVTERIHTFHIVTKPVIEYYKQKGILTTINANRSEEEIFSDVVKLFSTFPLISGSLLTDIKVIFVVGGPGSGKGTQCARMVDQYGFCHLSSGDLLREEVATQSTRGKELNAIMERGELVPLDIVLQLIREAMITNSSKSNCFLIDGYPRKLEQGIKFEKEIGPCRGVLYFEVPDSVMVERLLERAKTSGRIDDNEETIKKRLETFHNETKPVISYYNNLKKVVKVNADGSQDNVFAQVKTYLDSHSW